jgi:hypothetical protein
MSPNLPIADLTGISGGKRLSLSRMSLISFVDVICFGVHFVITVFLVALFVIVFCFLFVASGFFDLWSCFGFVSVGTAEYSDSL